MGSSETIKFKRVFKEIDERNSEEFNYPLMSVSRYKGVIPRSELKGDDGRADSLDNYKVCRPNQIVINRMSAASGAVGIAHVNGLISPDYAVLEINELADPDYILYLMKSAWFVSEMVSRLRGIGAGGESASVRTPRINVEDLGDITIPLPTLAQQKRLAKEIFIFSQASSEVVNYRSQQLSSFVESKKAIIESFLFPTGILCEASEIRSAPELSDPFTNILPSDWKKMQFRNLVKSSSIESGGKGDLLSVYLNEGVIPFSSGGEDRVHNPSEDMSKYQIVRVGNLVMNNQQAWRGSVGVSNFDGIISPAYHIYEISDLLLPEYANLFFRSSPLVFLYEQVSRGVGNIQRNLDSNSLMSIPVVVPPLDFQLSSIERIKLALTPIEENYKLVEKGIELIDEYQISKLTNVLVGEFFTEKEESHVNV